MSSGFDVSGQGPYTVFDRVASSATRKGLLAATLRIEMMNRFHGLLSGDDYEQLRMTSHARAMASALAEQFYKYNRWMQIYVTTVLPQIVDTSDNQYVQLAGHPHIIDAFLHLKDHILQSSRTTVYGNIMPF